MCSRSGTNLELSVSDGVLGLAPGVLDAELSFSQVNEDTVENESENDTEAAATHHDHDHANMFCALQRL